MRDSLVGTVEKRGISGGQRKRVNVGLEMVMEPLLGNFRHPHARTGGVLIFAHRRVKHTDTIFYVVRQNRLHPRERVHIIRDI